MTAIGPRLKRERVRLKLSQSALGAIGGVESNAQGNYENGLRSPRAEYLARVSQIGIDVSYVVTGNITPAPPYPATDTSPAASLEQAIHCLHESLHDMTRHLYRMTRLLESRQNDLPEVNPARVDAIRNDAEAISLAAVRLMYETSTLS